MVNVQDTGKHETDTPPKNLTLKWYKKNTEKQRWMDEKYLSTQESAAAAPMEDKQTNNACHNPLIVVSCIRKTKSPQVLEFQCQINFNVQC